MKYPNKTKGQQARNALVLQRPDPVMRLNNLTNPIFINFIMTAEGEAGVLSNGL